MTAANGYRWFAESRWIFLLVGTVVLSVAGNGWLADGLWLALEPQSAGMSVAAKAILALGVVGSVLPLGLLALIRVREKDRLRSWPGLIRAVGRELVHRSESRRSDGPCARMSGVVCEGAAWVSVFATVGLGVGAGWMADGAFGASAYQAVIGLLVAVIFAWIAYRAVPRALPIHARLEEAGKREARAFIAPLSSYRLGEMDSDRGKANLLDLIGESDLESLAQRVAEDEGLRRSNLRPLLVALQAHLPSVKYAALIPPKLDKEDDQKGYDAFYSWLNRELKKHGVKVAEMMPEDSGSFRAIYEAMARAIDEVHGMASRDGERLLDSEIVIDATGGKKPASIGAAAASLDREVTFEYVDTEALNQAKGSGQDCIRTYDIEYRAD
jgi:hypothetical protein